MKLILIFLLSLSLHAAGPGHVPLDLTFEESIAWMKQQEMSQQTKEGIADVNIRKAIAGGKKLNEWLKLVNESRSNNDQVRLTSKSTQVGIPIDKPSKYGPRLIKERLDLLLLEMPNEIKKIIYGRASISNKLPLEDEKFIPWGRRISKLYQSSVRWNGSVPWLEQYKARKAKDVRGFYELKKIVDLDLKLKGFLALDEGERKSLKIALLRVCENSFTSEKGCQIFYAKALKSNDLLGFKNKYWPFAVKNWDSFFKITKPRTDVVWTKSAAGIMEVTFKDPKNSEISEWLKENIEDEFQFKKEGWKLEMHFVRGSWGTAHLEFKPNVTPHVTGGNKVVMDRNIDIQEYGVRWTIRHEYGHILRLPDCYHEFYDSENHQMVNYQLDTTDLMCSRSGQMNERIYNELKRAYLK